MSMTAQFVQTSAAKPAELIDDPESVGELFSGDAPVISMQRPINLSEAQRQRIIEQGSQMLEETLARLDPKMREALDVRLGQLGVDPADLGKGAGGEALLNLMMARAGGASRGGARGQGASSSRVRASHLIRHGTESITYCTARLNRLRRSSAKRSWAAPKSERISPAMARRDISPSLKPRRCHPS